MHTSHKRPFILVIDPSPTIRTIIEVTLKRAGAEVAGYGDPLEALRAVIQHRLPPPDVLIVELVLPGKTSGYTLIRAFRSHVRTQPLAIIAISQFENVLPRLFARLAGANAYLSKPFKTQQLLDLVMEYAPH